MGNCYGEGYGPPEPDPNDGWAMIVTGLFLICVAVGVLALAVLP
jgi:hypothetical protein